MQQGIKFSLTADGAQAEKALNSLEHKIDSVVESVKGIAIAAFGIGTLESMFEKTVQTAEELVNASTRLKIGVEMLQTMKVAAREAGTEFGKLESWIEKVGLLRDKALGGGAGAAKALKDFQRFSVSENDLKTKSSAQLFEQVGSASKNFNPDTISSELKDMFGKSFGEAIPLLQTNFDELSEKLKSVGAIMDTETAVSLKLVGEEMGLVGNVLTVQFAPAIIAVVKALLWATSQIKNVGSILGANSVGQAHTSRSESRELDFLEQWKRGKRSFKDLMNNPDFANGMTDGNRAVLFKENKAGIDNFVQRRIDYLRTKDGIEGKVANEEISKNDSLLPDFEKAVKDLADKLKNPQKLDTSKKIDANVKPKAELGKMMENSFIKIGGFLGVDASYRLQRLTEKSTEYLRQIAQNTSALLSGDSTNPQQDLGD